MGTKRSAQDSTPTLGRHTRQQAKRTKLSPAQEDTSNSSEPSSCSVSEDSALQSTPPASDHTRTCSFSSDQLASTNADNDSDSGTSTSSESSESDSDEEIITLGGARKPPIQKPDMSNSAGDLRARLAALLPQMAEANRLLGEKGEGASMEDIEEGEQHIEMDLGLGVLEERHEGDSTSESSESSDEDGGGGERDVLGRLMGRERAGRGVCIEDVD